ncbi:glycosyltransferase [Clostridium tyrobutyricum]|uniref:glycosyltransferase n=1 Tax=Clostridium tyrobutyricum TaxID=1519 RepID=UPI0011CC1939|nr:glycosyltransferase family 2 protein [Clostridium tyrobutyricum]
MLLSIGMMVKNEEKHLDECLKSLLPILEKLDSELVIVDTGSTDRTVDIAKKYTDKVYFHKWNNNFSEMRNITIGYCSGEWFFYIDGDEILESCEDIINFFKSSEYKSYNTAGIYIKNLVDLSNTNNYSVFSAIRLFRKDREFKFIGAVHNQPQWKQPIKYLSSSCIHYGYISTDKELMEKKFKRTSSILKKELEKNPGNIYYMYQLSVSLSMHGDFKEASEQIQKTYDYIKKKNIDIKQYFYVIPHISLCYLNQKEYEKSKKYAQECLSYNRDYIDAYFYLGYSQFMLKEYKESLNNFIEYERLIKDYKKLLNNPGNIYYTIGRINDVYFYMYIGYRELKNVDKAVEYLLKIEDKKYNINKEIVSIFIDNNMYDKLLEYVNKLIGEEKNSQLEEIYVYIEWYKIRIDKSESNKLTEIFTNDRTPYGKLNSIRIKYMCKDSDLLTDIENLLAVVGIEKTRDYYGDLLYYMLKYKKDISQFVVNAPYGIINNFIRYISVKYDDLWDTICDYIEIYAGNGDFASLKINKELCRYSLLLGKNKLGEDKFQNIFIKYIDIGIEYINKIYTDFALENERYMEARTQEEGFFMFLRKAKQIKDNDKNTYVQYVRRALEIYPCMKDGIKLILDEIKAEDDVSNNEFEQYKIRVKDTIKSLIENDRLEDAGEIIKEYEDIVKDDVEIMLFKSQISLKKLKQVNTNYKM